MGFVFQNSDVQLFCPTVYEEIAFGPLQLNLSAEEVRSRVEDVLEMMQIGKLPDRSPHTLSGGEKKKVCIATVLVNNPDVLLLDEPSAGLDPRTQLWLVDLLVELGRAGKTVITATHDLEIIDQISKRAIIMGEDHRVKMDKDSKSHRFLSNYELLLFSANLVHELILICMERWFMSIFIFMEKRMSTISIRTKISRTAKNPEKMQSLGDLDGQNAPHIFCRKLVREIYLHFS